MVKIGDFVVYKPKNEIGRVAGIKYDGCHVCYHTGCTSAFTSWDHLRRATEKEIRNANPDLGFNRFKNSCDKYDEEICSQYCKEKFDEQQSYV